MGKLMTDRGATKILKKAQSMAFKDDAPAERI